MNKSSNGKSLRRQVLTGLAIALLLCVSFAAFIHFYTRPFAQESGQRALLAQLRIDLQDYREQHGAYPADLSAVHVSNFVDGSSPATLRQFHYISDGTSFTVTCVGASTHETIVVSSADFAAFQMPK